MKHLFKVIIFLFIALSPFVYGQEATPQYNLKVKLIEAKKTLEVSQTIQFQNNTKTPLQALYFNDWSHAYSSSKSPLAQRFAEEYDRRFYLGSKPKRGETRDLNITIKGKKTDWYRVDNQIDIIKITLDEILEPGDQINISLTYTIVLPDASFTGYGRISEEEYFLKNLHSTKVAVIVFVSSMIRLIGFAVEVEEPDQLVKIHPLEGVAFKRTDVPAL